MEQITTYRTDASLRDVGECLPADEASGPDAVLADPSLSKAEKRVLLAAWASDANAAESQSGLRRRPGFPKAAVPLSAVLGALHRLDDDLDGDWTGDIPRLPPLPPRRRPLPARVGTKRALH